MWVGAREKEEELIRQSTLNRLHNRVKREPQLSQWLVSFS